jgi:signal transduction histidine kinase
VIGRRGAHRNPLRVFDAGADSYTMRPRHQPLLEELAEPMIRVLATLANVAWIVIVVTGVAIGDADLTFTAWPAALMAVVAVGLLATGRHDLRLLFVATLVVLVIAGLTIGEPRSQAPIVISLAATGIMLSMYVRRRLVLYISGYSVAMILVVIWNHPDTAGAVITATTSAIIFAFTTYLVRRLTLHAEGETERYVSLFNHSPIALWEEDFTGVDKFLRGLRASGVTDLEEYLRSHPEAALRISGLIEVTAVNDSAVRLLEADSPTQLLGQIPNRDDSSLDALTAQLLAVWRGDDHIVTEVSDAVTMRGHHRHLTLSWTAPLLEGRPDYAHVSVAGVDVTESRATRKALEGLLRSKDELVATVSHELRTPLTTVVGLADELNDSIDNYEDAELRELISLIASEGREVSTIVEDLLVAAQAETGSLRLTPIRVDLVQLAKDVHRALPKNAEVATYLPEQPVWVVADPTRTRQIVRNLVINADRYGGGDIRICVAASGKTAALEVRDGGAPLPFREREAIFDRFYRARQVPGLTASVGLGLTVSRQLARDMDGDLTYSHDGEEAIFELVLPRFVAQPEELETRREAAG